MTRAARAAAAIGLLLLAAGSARAQAHNPFGGGISEGGGSATGLVGWMLAQQAGFERALAAAGYPTGGNHGPTDIPALLAGLLILAIGATALYGPQAACL